jgi:formylglycine-generating enzyme required for sulfatase activity
VEEKYSGRLYRLPTEAEWEYACRGGATSSKPFSFGDSLCSTQANFHGNYPSSGAVQGPYLGCTTPVGSYKPNTFGLYDMHGNVWEWCRDWYGENYYSRSPRLDPQGQPNGRARVVRGVSWDIWGEECSSAIRNRREPGFRENNIGFRVVCIVSS